MTADEEMEGNWEPSPCPECGGMLMVFREKGTPGVALGKLIVLDYLGFGCPFCGFICGINTASIHRTKSQQGPAQ